jgi:hypothetical protein
MREGATNPWQSRVNVDRMMVLKPIRQVAHPGYDLGGEERTASNNLALLWGWLFAGLGNPPGRKRAHRSEASIAGRLKELRPSDVDNAKPRVFVVAAQGDYLGVALALKLAHAVYHARRIGSAVEVVSREDQSVVLVELRQPREKNLESDEIPVDVSDCEGTPHTQRF